MAKPYPELGVPFELTLDGDAPETQPLAMVEADGYNPDGWKHNGKIVVGKQTRRFKLVQKGGSWGEIGAVTGKEVEGQWRNAFKATYPEPDGNGPIGVRDASWVHPRGYTAFPCVDHNGDSRFGWVDDFPDHWRWIVPAE